jgi:hypothetical protein
MAILLVANRLRRHHARSFPFKRVTGTALQKPFRRT